MRIRYKLLSTLLAVAVPAVILVGWLGYRSGELALAQAAFNELTAVRAGKADRIETYLANVRELVALLSYSHLVRAGLREFGSAVDALESGAGPSAQGDPTDADALEAYYRDTFLARLREHVAAPRAFEHYWPRDLATRHLQEHYIVRNQHPPGHKHELDRAEDGSEYSEVHARHHPLFRRTLETFGFYDVFLIDAASGRILYSVSKETDFGTSLRDGPYRDSGLGLAFEAARAGAGVRMVDFSFYDPSYGAPALFVATPVAAGERLGVLAVQLPIDEINRVMTGGFDWEADGLGESGETYLVGSDHRMRSVSRFWIQERPAFLEQLAARGVPDAEVARMQAFDTTILLQEVRSQASEDALRGNARTAVVDDYRGVPVLSSYQPLDVDGVEWVVLSEIDVEEAFAPITHLARSVLAAGALVALLVLAVAIVAARRLVRPIDALAAGAREVSAGNLEVALSVSSRDELGQLAGTFNDMVASLKDKTETIRLKNRENEKLLLNILPGEIADRLKGGEETIADAYAEVTVLFADLVGFTDLSSRMAAPALVEWLNELFSGFDQLAYEHGIEKIKTIGDAYMAVCGLPARRDDHAEAMAEMAIGMLAVMRRFNASHQSSLGIRIGLNSGPVVAGVIGTSKFIYDLWGDTVNVASRMESHGLPDAIQVTESTYERLRGRYRFESRGEIEVKGKGRVAAWLLTPPASASAADPVAQ